MPFDGLTNKTTNLADTARLLGITPIPNDVWTAHKATELKKHRGSRWYAHRAYIPPLLFGGFFLSLAVIILVGVAACDAMMDDHPMVATIEIVISSLAVFSVAKIVTSGILGRGLTIEGPAQWVEIFSPRLKCVPDEIARMARQVKAMMPNSYITVGELRRQSVTLDPYLVVRHEAEQIVLGIWDDHGIIKIATQTD